MAELDVRLLALDVMDPDIEITTLVPLVRDPLAIGGPGWMAGIPTGIGKPLNLPARQFEDKQVPGAVASGCSEANAQPNPASARMMKKTKMRNAHRRSAPELDPACGTGASEGGITGLAIGCRSRLYLSGKTPPLPLQG
jgi:hypothetical protein